MRLVVSGNRFFDNYKFFKDYFKPIVEKHKVIEIVQGGCRGVDALAVRFAIEFSIPYVTFEADWKTLGRAAGPIRNKKMVEYGDGLVAFWWKNSKGTADAIHTAIQQDKLISVIKIGDFENPVLESKIENYFENKRKST